ncbi:hypothetical protein C5O80_13650 [Burkholderia sp. SRS-46]|nr:hypothetical protein C5O80_13650 [Burkholderia sp. SRS-46]
MDRRIYVIDGLGAIQIDFLERGDMIGEMQVKGIAAHATPSPASMAGHEFTETEVATTDRESPSWRLQPEQ